jgi:hypothetical protein
MLVIVGRSAQESHPNGSVPPRLFAVVHGFDPEADALADQR